MKSFVKILCLATVMGAFSAPAFAQEGEEKWIVQAGLTRIKLRNVLDINVAGAPFPGSAMSTKAHYTPSLQIGRFVHKHVALTATVGLPPKIDINGAGTIGAVGKLGETTYGPIGLTGRFYPMRKGTVQPYVGAGLTYMIVFNAKDAGFQNLKIKNDLAPLFEAGANVMITPKYGVFFDLKKAYLRPKATGTFMGLPVDGKTKLDPLIISTGVTVKF
jgi:outer membrane protein